MRRKLVVTRPSPSAWLLTARSRIAIFAIAQFDVRWKIQAGTAIGYLRLQGARLELVARGDRRAT